MSSSKTISAAAKALHLERSLFIDTFAGLEKAAIKFGPSDQALREEIESLRQVRNDIVHAQLACVNYDGKPHAVFVNNQQVAKPNRQARLLTVEDFKSLRLRINAIRKKIEAA